MIDSAYNNNLEGHVKLEKIKDGEVIDTVENHNTVVHGSNEILASVLANPIEKTRMSHKSEGPTDVLPGAERDSFEYFIPFNSSELKYKTIGLGHLDQNLEDDLQKYEFVLEDGEVPVKRIARAGIVDKENNVLYEMDLSRDIFVANNKSGKIGIIHDLTGDIDGETFTSVFDSPVDLSKKDMVAGSIVVKTTDGSNTFAEGADYTVDTATGTITVLSTGSMSDATDYSISYSYEYNRSDTSLKMKFYRRSNYSTSIISGSEVVYAGPDITSAVKYEREQGEGNVEDGVYYPDSDNTTNTYGIDYDAGVVYFGEQKEYVKVEYDYEVAPGANYMGLSDMPDDHDPRLPVSITEQTHLYATELDNEYKNARRPVKFPCSWDRGVERVKKFQAKFDGYEYFEYDAEEPILVNSQDTDPIILNEVGTTLKQGEHYEVDSSGIVKVFNNMFSVDHENMTITFHADSTEFSGSSIFINYSYEDQTAGETKQNTDSVSTSTLTAGDDVVSLVHAPVEGSVRVTSGSDLSSSSPVGIVRNFEFKYSADVGVIVNFVADFPNGTIEPIQNAKKVDYFNETQDFNAGTNGREISLSEDINMVYDAWAKASEDDAWQKLEANVDYTHRNGNFVIGVNDGTSEFAAWPTDSNGNQYRYFKISYGHYKDEFGVYEVGLFNGRNPDSENSIMFAIAGLGPVYVDQNTGLRITWSITFKKNNPLA